MKKDKERSLNGCLAGCLIVMACSAFCLFFAFEIIDWAIAHWLK